MRFQFREAAPDYRGRIWYWWVDAFDGSRVCIPRDDFWRGNGMFVLRRAGYRHLEWIPQC